MSHFRRAVGLAVALNTSIFVGEGLAAWRSHSLSLLTDSVHNFSDELALIGLYGAFLLPGLLSRNSQRVANLLNSVGLIALSAVLAWKAVGRLSHPVVVSGALPIAVGLAAAAANWGVARLLAGPGRSNAAIRLAYLHNLGDVGVSLAPVLSGLLLALTGRSVFDPLVALAVAAWLGASTVKELRSSSEELIWPEVMTCVHEPGRTGLATD
ncbi:MAG TPA: cation transporter [Gemmatimonadales bacterium]|nr:cation transporter [Gemmatimonadales bacterium]